MIVNDIGLLNRRQRRVANKKLRKLGLRTPKITRSNIDAHARLLTRYIVDVKRHAMATAEPPDDETVALVTYLNDLSTSTDELIGVEPGEKVAHTGSLNFISIGLADQQREMIALMAQAPGAEDPLEHYMISWGDDERPTPAQVDAAVKIVLKVLGLERHQTIYALHSNTDHDHVHIAVNRVDPTTFKRTAAGGGFQINGLHQAIAIIEFEQGWKPNDAALYKADAFGVVHIDSNERVRHCHGATGSYPRHVQLQPLEQTSASFDAVTETLSHGAHLYERRTNEWSFERIAKMVAAPIIRRARSFEDMHDALAEEGIGYERKGSHSGAVLTMQGRAIKATTAGREMAIEHLQKRPDFGTFTPCRDDLELSEPRHRPVDPDRPLSTYRWAKAAHKKDRETLKRELLEVKSEAIHAVQVQAAELNSLISAHDWTGNGHSLNLARSLVAARRREATSALWQRATAA